MCASKVGHNFVDKIELQLFTPRTMCHRICALHQRVGKNEPRGQFHQRWNWPQAGRRCLAALLCIAVLIQGAFSLGGLALNILPLEKFIPCLSAFPPHTSSLGWVSPLRSSHIRPFHLLPYSLPEVRQKHDKSFEKKLESFCDILLFQRCSVACSCAIYISSQKVN